MSGEPDLVPLMSFERAAVPQSDKGRRIKQRDYLPEGRIPVIDQGRSELGGYTDDEALAFDGALPVILFGDHTRAVKLVERRFAVGADGIKIFRPAEGVRPRYLYYWMRSARIPDRGYGRHYQYLRKMTVPVPSLAKQDDVVAEIEKQFSRLDEAVANLQRVKAKLKRYKAAVLKAAVEGRLVSTEAAIAHQDGVRYETAAELLERVLSTRRILWSGRGECVEPIVADTTDLAALPDGWIWASADQLSDFITKGTTPSASKLSEGAGEVQFLKVYNLTFDGSLNHLHKPAFVSSNTHNGELGRSRVRPGDVLINIVGPPLGQVSVVPTHLPEANINQAIARFRPVEPLNSRFVAIALMCDDIMRWAIRRAKTTVGQSNLTLELCRALPLPLPPVAEQRRILAEVDRRLSIVREVELEVDANLKRAQALRQAVLGKAFNGGHAALDDLWDEEEPHRVPA